MGDDLILEYSFDRKKNYSLMKGASFYGIIITIGFVYFYYYEGNLALPVILIGMVPILIQIVIHLQYYFLDKNKTITVNHSKRKLTYKDNNKEKIIAYDEIEKVISRQSQRQRNNYSYVFPFNHYHHTEIKLKSGKSYYFSDLIAENINLNGVDKELRLCFINLII